MIPTSLSISSFPVFAAAWLLSYAIHSTILLGSVWLIARWTRPFPGLLDSLWKMALVGGIVTATWQVVGPGNATLGGRLALDTPAPVQATSDFVFYSGDPSHFTSPSQPSTPFWTPVIKAVNAYWPAAILVIWALGASLGMGRLLAQRLRLARALRGRRRLEDHLARAILNQLCRKSGITHPVHLSTSSRLSGPVAMNSREICLPERALRMLSPEQLENVLAHELAHVARRDPAWRWMSAVVERLFFFQPLNRNARKGLRDVAEFMCDDWAVRHTGQNVTLAKCLVEVAGWMKSESRPVAAAGMAEHGSPLVRRVERLLSGKKGAELSRNWKLAAVSVLLLGVVMTAPSVTVNPGGASSAVPATDSPRSANNWISATSSTHTPFYFQGEYMPMSPGPVGEKGLQRTRETRSTSRNVRIREPRHIRTVQRAAPPASRVVLRTQEPDPEPAPAPSLIVVTETTDRHAVVFSVEVPVDPIRVRLDRLVGELERLEIEFEGAQLGAHTRTIETLARRKQELWPRLLELQEKLHDSGTLSLEVWATVDREDAKIQDLIRLKTTERELHLQEMKNLQEMKRIHQDHQHRGHKAPAVVRI